MKKTDHRKQSIYVPDDMIIEVETQAARHDRSISAMFQMAWKIASNQIATMRVHTEIE